MRAYSRDALDNYLKAVSHYRGFRLRFDSITSNLLDQLQNTEKERTKMVHRLLNVYLEIQTVMVRQSLKNIETIQEHIKKVDADADNAVFAEKTRSQKEKPPLPDPMFHPDDLGLFSFVSFPFACVGPLASGFAFA